MREVMTLRLAVEVAEALREAYPQLSTLRARAQQACVEAVRARGVEWPRCSQPGGARQRTVQAEARQTCPAQ